jgi:phosphoribosylformimino-5-aminoimidazole carboxamide ribotide isomerase
MIRIIPAIDIIEGKCVRLTQGDYTQKKIYNEDPLEVAKMFESVGYHYLHLIDLDGAREKHVVNLKTLEKLSKNTSLSIDFGGGIKTNNDLQSVFQAGASQVTIGSIAITQPALFFEWLNTYGSDKVILGADVKDKKIAISGWKEITSQELLPFLELYIGKGVKNILCTDISLDGMLKGTALDLYKELNLHFPSSQIIASGGITNKNEINALDKDGIFGVVIGKAFYEGYIKPEELLEFLK